MISDIAWLSISYMLFTLIGNDVFATHGYDVFLVHVLCMSVCLTSVMLNTYDQVKHVLSTVLTRPHLVYGAALQKAHNTNVVSAKTGHNDDLELTFGVPGSKWLALFSIRLKLWVCKGLVTGRLYIDPKRVVPEHV